jgi:hypothetical protein
MVMLYGSECAEQLKEPLAHNKCYRSVLLDPDMTATTVTVTNNNATLI